MALTLQSTWPRIKPTTHPKLTSQAQAPLDVDVLCPSFLLSSGLLPVPTQQPPLAPPVPCTCLTHSNPHTSEGGANLHIVCILLAVGASSFSVSSLGMLYGVQLDYPGTIAGWAGGGARKVRKWHVPQLPSTRTQLPLLLGPLSLQEPLIFPLGIPTCWGERLCWEAATPSITKAISTT